MEITYVAVPHKKNYLYFQYDFFYLFTYFNYILLYIGVCEVGGSLADGGAALVIADIPGLVEGAHMVSEREREDSGCVCVSE